ncbi:MAG TPA: SDR family NAD(P)-dependent oxidoreductase, partial [Spirochaetia bacterium]
EDAPDVLMSATEGHDVGLLVCDAALASTGPFLDQDISVYRTMLDVNCASFLGLVHGFGRRFASRKKGGIVIMSSMAAFHGSPMVAVYSATKSFLLTLAEGVGAELAPRGVDVVACCPSVVLTPHFLSDGHNPRKVPLALEPAFVAREALHGLGRRRIVVPSVPGRVAHFFMSRLLPRTAAVAMIGRNTRVMYGE